METKRSFKKTAIEVGKRLIVGAALCAALTSCAFKPTTDGRGYIGVIAGEPVSYIGKPMVAHKEAVEVAEHRTKAMLRQHTARSHYDTSWSWGDKRFTSATARIVNPNKNLYCTIRIRETSPLFGTADCTEITPRTQRPIRMNCDVYGNAYNEVEEMRCKVNGQTFVIAPR